MKSKIIVIYLFICSSNLFGQGYNHQWLLGYVNAPYLTATMSFDSSSYNLQTGFRKMKFDDAEGNISDQNGNFLMSSNGQWIANANNDTMLNGSGLNPCPDLLNYPRGSPLAFSNLILPFPGDSLKYILFHHGFLEDGLQDPTYAIMQSIIDMTLDGGLGGITIKNDTILSDTLNWGFGACKHANGRDWWIVVQKQNSPKLYKILLTPIGIQSITLQNQGG